MTGRFRQALLEKGKMPKKFSVKSGDKSAAGGLTAKGVKRYRAANPGSKLKTAVTTKPSKLKKGSKAASRRKSFCARMGGMKKRLTSKKTASDPDSRINKALRKWNCSTDVNPNALQQMAEMIVEMITRDRSGNRGAGIKGIMQQLADKRKSKPETESKPKTEPKPKPKAAVEQARLGLAEAVLKQAPSFRDRVRKRELQGDSRVSAISKEKLAQDDAKVKAAQGKNTVTKTFGKKGTQSSTTAYSGKAGSEEAKAEPMPKSQIDRAKGDEETIANKAKANQDAFDNLMKSLASRG